MGLVRLLTTPLLMPRVVHSLPGRLRLAVPGLRRLGNAGVVDLPAAWLGLVDGVTAVRSNLVSRTVLIHYDPTRVSEERLVEGARRLARYCLDHRATLEGLAGTPADEVLDRLRPAVTRILAEGAGHGVS